jgi:transposase-like protein
MGSREGEFRPMSDFKGRHVEGKIVLWAVRWYCRYGVSYRELEQMMGERGVSVDHSTIDRWVQRFAPEIEKRLRWQWRGPRSASWRVDETYVKVRGPWAYLYRALDKHGSTIEFSLSPTRNTAAAKRFLGKALQGLKDWEKPSVTNTDKAPKYAAAPADLKAEGRCPADTLHSPRSEDEDVSGERICGAPHIRSYASGGILWRQRRERRIWTAPAPPAAT